VTTMMSKTVKAVLSTGVNIVVSAIVAGGVSYLAQVRGDTIIMQKTAKLETVVDYAKSESPISPFAAKYIAAITSNGDIKQAQTDLRAKLGEEMEKAEKLRPVFVSAIPDIERYQNALGRFASSIDGATDATRMTEWTENFGRVIDSRLALERTLLKEAGGAG
jgi:hypothetical protein